MSLEAKVQTGHNCAEDKTVACNEQISIIVFIQIEKYIVCNSIMVLKISLPETS